MRLLLVIAAAAAFHAAGPVDAGAAPPKRAPKTACAKTAKAHASRAGRPAPARRGVARRRAVARRCASRSGARVGRARAGLIGIPGALVAPLAFETELAPAPDGSPAPASTPPAPGGSAGPELPPVYSNPRAVQVRATEFRFQLSKSAVSSGTVSVEFNLSAAEDPHDLWLVREDGTGSAYSFGETPAGAVVTSTLPLTTGRWTLFCSLTGHQAAGMRSALTVG